jgi:hypothetical protein
MEELFLGAVKSSCVILKVVSCAGAAIPAQMAAQCACEPSSQLSPHDIITRVIMKVFTSLKILIGSVERRAEYVNQQRAARRM